MLCHLGIIHTIWSNLPAVLLTLSIFLGRSLPQSHFLALWRWPLSISWPFCDVTVQVLLAVLLYFLLWLLFPFPPNKSTGSSVSFLPLLALRHSIIIPVVMMAKYLSDLSLWVLNHIFLKIIVIVYSTVILNFSLSKTKLIFSFHSKYSFFPVMPALFSHPGWKPTPLAPYLSLPSFLSNYHHFLLIPSFHILMGILLV